MPLLGSTQCTLQRRAQRLVGRKILIGANNFCSVQTHVKLDRSAAIPSYPVRWRSPIELRLTAWRRGGEETMTRYRLLVESRLTAWWRQQDSLQS